MLVSARIGVESLRWTMATVLLGHVVGCSGHELTVWTEKPAVAWRPEAEGECLRVPVTLWLKRLLRDDVLKRNAEARAAKLRAKSGFTASAIKIQY